jgi:CRISPR-associated protein (TIGR02584 family)
MVPRKSDRVRPGTRDDGGVMRVLCLAGNSPGVVTETLYALAIARGEQITHLHILTTSKGKERMETSLPDALAAMRADYPEQASNLPEEPLIEAIKDREGNPLEDISTSAQSAIAGDRILTLVRIYTDPTHARLHASLAGGRKTMSYYMGMAMAMCARAEDELSHVLVDPVAEFSRTFYYPTPEPRDMEGSLGAFDASKVEVLLHTLPVFRMRGLLEHRGYKDRAVSSFADYIGVAQRAIEPALVTLDLNNYSVEVDGLLLELSPTQTAIYSVMLLDRYDRREGGRRSRIWSTKTRTTRG